jgi:hypothetical protein
MGKTLYKINGIVLFLIAAMIFLGFLGEVHQISKAGEILSLLLIIIGMAVSIAAGIFFTKTNDVKSKLLNTSAWLIFAPVIAFILLAIVLTAAFTISGGGGLLGVGILLSLLATVLGSVSGIGIILWIIYIIKKNSPKL